MLIGTVALAQLFTPSEIGTYSYVASACLLLSGIAGLRYEWAIALPERDRDAANLLVLHALLVMATAIIVSGILIGLWKWAPESDLYPFPWVWFLPLAILATGLFNGVNQAAIRMKRYGAVAQRSLTQAVVTMGAQAGGGALGLGPGSLYIGLALGRFTSFWSLTAKLPRDWLRGRPGVDLTTVAKTYWRFPLAYAPSSLLNLLGSFLPVFVIASLFGPADTGRLGMAQALTVAPLSLLAGAVSQVWIGELSSKLRSNTPGVRSDFIRLSALLGSVAGLSALLLLTIAPALAVWLLGERWREVGEMIRAAAPAAAIGLLASPLSFVFVAFQRMGVSIFLDTSRVLMLVMAAWLAHTTDQSAVTTVLWMSLAQAGNYALTWILSLRLVVAHEGANRLVESR